MTAPSAQELIEQSKKAVFLHNYRVSFTPADLTRIKSEQEFEHGAVVAHVDSSAATSKAPARGFDLFVRKTDGNWHAYAIEDGHVVTDFATVQIVSATEAADARTPHPVAPHPEGKWCFTYVVKIPWTNKSFIVKVCFGEEV